MLVLGSIAALVLAACAPAAEQAGRTGQSSAEGAMPQRTLVVAVRGEAPTIANKPLVGFSGALQDLQSPFNAALDGKDERGVPSPHLAEALPEANTENWRVLPDGRMETTYRLKPTLTWHDGTPLTSADFVFSWQVYSTPELGTAKSAPTAYVEDVVARDDRTFTIVWKQIYADAGELGDGFPALPRHLLQEEFAKDDYAEFPNLAYWSTEYVGLGPYRLTHWEPGTFVEAEAFPEYVLGRPKIERLKILFIPDPNTALANLFAGDGHYVGQFVLAPDHAGNLEREWSANRGGTVLYGPTGLRRGHVQLREELVSPAALLDGRVRRALAHALDRLSASEVLHAGKGIVTDSFTSPLVPYYDRIERVIAKYPYDPRRSEQLMAEAGYLRGSEGFFVDQSGNPMDFGVYSSSGTKNEQENAVIVDGLRGSGFNARTNILPAAQSRDSESYTRVPGILAWGGGGSLDTLSNLTIDEVARPENRWRGRNYGAWVSPAYDRAYAAFNQTLKFSDRVTYIAEMNRLISEELPTIMYWYQPIYTAHVAALTGPVPHQTPDSGPGMLRMHEWHRKE
jgi:peptide/nickel transport system substrate-binding protein